MEHNRSAGVVWPSLQPVVDRASQYDDGMRLALISDLHANELALDAVLADARGAGFDQLVCLGDVATLGPRASAVLERLRSLGCPCIMGNHDEFMLDAALVRTYSEFPLIVASVDATRESLSADDLQFIAGFQRTLMINDEVLLYHGSPRSNVEDLLAATPSERVDEMLDGRTARVFAGGHTHIQMLRQHRGMLIVNVGSLGLPFREFVSGGPPTILSHAEYALVEVRHDHVSVDLRRVPLDRSALASQIDGWGNPLAAPLRAMYG
jgi:predicted phosphodiesterase